MTTGISLVRENTESMRPPRIVGAISSRPAARERQGTRIFSIM